MEGALTSRGDGAGLFCPRGAEGLRRRECEEEVGLRGEALEVGANVLNKKRRAIYKLLTNKAVTANVQISPS